MHALLLVIVCVAPAFLSERPRTSAPVINLLNARVSDIDYFYTSRLPGEPLMSRDNLRSMQVPNVASGQLPGLADLGIQPAALEAAFIAKNRPHSKPCGMFGTWQLSAEIHRLPAETRL